MQLTVKEVANEERLSWGCGIVYVCVQQPMRLCGVLQAPKLLQSGILTKQEVAKVSVNLSMLDDAAGRQWARLVKSSPQT